MLNLVFWLRRGFFFWLMAAGIHCTQAPELTSCLYMTDACPEGSYCDYVTQRCVTEHLRLLREQALSDISPALAPQEPALAAPLADKK